MPTIEKRLRSTVIDHDPKTGDIVGATKFYEQVLVDARGQVEGKLEGSVHESIGVKDVPSLWGKTSDSHAAKLQETEEVLQSERDEWAKAEAVYKTSLETANEQVRQLEAANRGLVEKLGAVGQHLLAIGKILQS